MRIRLGFFLAKVLPPPFSTWSSGAAEIEELVPPQERSISSPSFPPLYILSFLSPTLSLISLSGTQSVSGSLSEFIISLRRPWPRWIRALKFFHQHLGKREKRLGRPSATKRRKHTKGGSSSVWTGPEGWNVCVHKPVTRQRVRADVRWGLGPD